METGESEAPPYYLLDTNILVAYIRQGALGAYIEGRFALRASPYKPMICVVSVGEVLALARKFAWADEKVGRMQRLLRQLVRIDISDDRVLNAYSELAEFTRTHETVPQNDIWIAATAKATGAKLLTTDKHFDQFHDRLICRVWIDEEAVRRGDVRADGGQDPTRN